MADLLEYFEEKLPQSGALEDQEVWLLDGIREYRAAMETKRLVSETASDEDKQFLAAHPERGAIIKVLKDTQREIYLKPELTHAIGAYRRAMLEWES